MKKTVVSLLLVFVLAVIPMISMATDYSSMSEEQLYEQLNMIRTALENKKHEGDQIISQADGITIYFSSAEVSESYDGSKKLTIKVTGISTADKATGIIIDKISINGWEINALDSMDLEAGKKAKKEFEFYEVDEKAEIKALEDIEEIEFYAHSYDPNSYATLTPDLHFIVRMK